MKWYSVRHSNGTAHVSILDGIGVFNGGAEPLIDEIGDARDIQLSIDSSGGDSVTANKLYDAIRGRTSLAVITRCSSAAVPIAMAAKRIVCFADAKFMIHPPRLQFLATRRRWFRARNTWKN